MSNLTFSPVITQDLINAIGEDNINLLLITAGEVATAGHFPPHTVVDSSKSGNEYYRQVTFTWNIKKEPKQEYETTIMNSSDRSEAITNFLVGMGGESEAMNNLMGGIGDSATNAGKDGVIDKDVEYEHLNPPLDQHYKKSAKLTIPIIKSENIPNEIKDNLPLPVNNYEEKETEQHDDSNPATGSTRNTKKAVRQEIINFQDDLHKILETLESLPAISSLEPQVELGLPVLKGWVDINIFKKKSLEVTDICGALAKDSKRYRLQDLLGLAYALAEPLKDLALLVKAAMDAKTPPLQVILEAAEAVKNALQDFVCAVMDLEFEIDNDEVRQKFESVARILQNQLENVNLELKITPAQEPTPPIRNLKSSPTYSMTIPGTDIPDLTFVEKVEEVMAKLQLEKKNEENLSLTLADGLNSINESETNQSTTKKLKPTSTQLDPYHNLTGIFREKLVGDLYYIESPTPSTQYLDEEPPRISDLEEYSEDEWDQEYRPTRAELIEARRLHVLTCEAEEREAQERRQALKALLEDEDEACYHTILPKSIYRLLKEFKITEGCLTTIHIKEQVWHCLTDIKEHEIRFLSTAPPNNNIDFLHFQASYTIISAELRDRLTSKKKDQPCLMEKIKKIFYKVMWIAPRLVRPNLKFDDKAKDGSFNARLTIMAQSEELLVAATYLFFEIVEILKRMRITKDALARLVAKPEYDVLRKLRR